MMTLRATFRPDTTPRILTITLCVAASLCVAGAALAAGTRAVPRVTGATAEAPRSGDELILAAQDASEKKDRDRLARLAREQGVLLRGHPLAVYLDFWLLRERVKSDAPAEVDAEVAAFMARHPDTYVADRLRLDWLMAVAARNTVEDWAVFERERANVIWNDEPQFRCWQMLSRYQRNEGRRIDELAREARELLAASRESGGDGCMRLTEVLLDDGRVSVWDRVRTLVENNQVTTAKRLAARTGSVSADDVAQLNAALDRPSAWLAARGAKLGTTEREIVLIALARLARDTPEAAARHALTLEPQFSAEQRGLAWGRIGHMAAIKHQREAHDWYRRGGIWVGVAPGTARADEVFEWQVRAALRHSDGPDWNSVAAITDRMPEPLRNDAAWVFWRARAQLARGNLAEVAEARERLRTLASTAPSSFDFYGLLAAETLGEPAVLPAAPATIPTEAVAAFDGNAGLERAFKFYELGLRVEGHREWNWQIRRANNGQRLDDRGLLALAEFARKRGAWDRVISTSERTRNEFDLTQRYPAPHRDQLFTHAQAAGLDAHWVYGLIRQESRFIADARSNVGAMGLMQLMPATARYVARRAGLTEFSQARITDTDLNLRLGTNYLRYVLDDLDGSPLLASAAYNAGPSRARAWRASLLRAVEGAIFAETIPFNETREYVKRVLANAAIYAAVLGDGRVPPLKDRLGSVAPKAAGTTELP
jgi:soluble lytic murein transglycosylase